MKSMRTHAIDFFGLFCLLAPIWGIEPCDFGACFNPTFEYITGRDFTFTAAKERV